LARLYDESDEAVILKRLQTSKELAIKNNLSFREAYSTLYDKKTGKAPDFKVDEEVMLHAPWLQTSVKNRKFRHPFIGPFKIIRLDMEKKIAEVKRRKQKFVVNLERIKKYFRPNKVSKLSCRHSPLSADETSPKQSSLTSSKYSAPANAKQNTHSPMQQAKTHVSVRHKVMRTKATAALKEKGSFPSSPPIAMRTRLQTKTTTVSALKKCFACVLKEKEKAPTQNCSACSFYRQLEMPNSPQILKSKKSLTTKTRN
jgi:hypothetical protein